MPKIEKSWRQERKERYEECEMDCDMTYHCLHPELPRQPTRLERFYRRFPWWNDRVYLCNFMRVNAHNLKDINKI